MTEAPEGDSRGDAPPDRPWSSKTTLRVEELLKAHAKALYGRLRASGCDCPTSEDIVQDTFVKLGVFLEKGGSISDNSKAYVIRTGVNIMIDKLRKDPGWYSESTDEPEDFDDPEAELAFERFIDLFSRRDEFLRLRAVIDKLPPRQRAVVLMRMNDCSTAEIADKLNIKAGTVRYHEYMGLEKLRQILDLDGDDN